MNSLFEGENLVNTIGFVAGIITAVSGLPQLVKTLKEKTADDLSPVMLLILVCGVSLWVVYGILKNDLPIILSNGFSALLNLSLLVLRWKYKK